MTIKTYTDYFFDEPAYNTHDGGYVPLVEPDTSENILAVPELLYPDKDTATDTYYTVEALAGETQVLPGAKTKTWGYNTSLLGKTILFEKGKMIHIEMVVVMRPFILAKRSILILRLSNLLLLCGSMRIHAHRQQSRFGTD